MNKICLSLGTLLVVGSVVPAYLDYRKTVKEEHAKRAQLIADHVKNMDAIRRAALKMEQRIKDPEYRPAGITQVMNDFDFEIIAAHNE